MSMNHHHPHEVRIPVVLWILILVDLFVSFLSLYTFNYCWRGSHECTITQINGLQIWKI